MYDNLHKSLSYNLTSEDLTEAEKNEQNELISKLDKDKHEIIYYLILIDYMHYNPASKVIYPYKMKQNSENELELKVDNLPIHLKKIIYRFVKLSASNESCTTLIN